MSLDDEARSELARLEAEHRLRVPRLVDGASGPRITIDGREVINLASNDYLSLAGDRRLVDATKASLDEDGLGAGASRLITGNHRRHVELERAIAEWLLVDGVRLFNTGYAANVGVLTTMLRAGDVVFSDELNHASIIDGCRLSRAEIVVFPHRDVIALESLMKTRRGRRRVVVSETLFSMDGDIAEIGALAELCTRHDAALVLDEAHAIGVFGPEGRGLAAMCGVTPDVLVGTCGKALGTFGAFAATSAAVAELLWNRARSLVFSTAMPPGIAAATAAAVALARGSEGDQRRRDLAARIAMLRSLAGTALDSSSSRLSLAGAPSSPIAPLLVGDDERVMTLSRTLLDAGVFAQGIRPPTVPRGTARIRISLCSGLTSTDIEIACGSIDNAVRQFHVKSDGLG